MLQFVENHLQVQRAHDEVKMAEGGEDGKYGLIKFLPKYLKLFSGFYEMSQTFCNTMFYRNCCGIFYFLYKT